MESLFDAWGKKNPEWEKKIRRVTDGAFYRLW